MSKKRSVKELDDQGDIDHDSKKSHKRTKHSHDSEADDHEFQKPTASLTGDKRKQNQWIDHPQWKYRRISEDDYYRYYTEFAEWALRKSKKFADEMSTSKRKKMFKKFVEKWNAGQLDERYYKKISSLSVDPRQKTRYQWSFESKIDPKEQMEFDLIRDQIDNETNDPTLAQQTAQRFLYKFDARREKHEQRGGRHGRDGDRDKKYTSTTDNIEFEHDNDGTDSRHKLDQQLKEKEGRHQQRRQDRKQRIKDIRRETDTQLLSSYQAFISSGVNSSKPKSGR